MSINLQYFKFKINTINYCTCIKNKLTYSDTILFELKCISI